MSGPAPRELEHLLEEDLEEAYEQAPAGYVATLPGGLIIRANATFLAWTGYARDELVRRRKFQELFSIPGRIYYETHLGPLLAMQGSLNEIALDIVRQDGAQLPALVNASQKCNAAGEPLLCRYTVFNATDRRRYERQLLEARRQAEAAAQEKTELLAMLSHDIRTPLSSIMAVTAILERSALAREQQAALRILRSSSATMLDLVNEVLEHGRIEAGAVQVHRDAFDLRALVRELAENLEPLAQHKGIELGSAVDARLPASVIGDRIKLGQVLGNLLGNALKFTEKGEVRIELAVLELGQAQVKVRARVVDTGIGIAEDAVPRILQRYGQAHEGIARRYGGTGLGLAISRKLLQAQGSDLQLASRPGQGSEFWFDVTLGLPEVTNGAEDPQRDARR